MSEGARKKNERRNPGSRPRVPSIEVGSTASGATPPTAAPSRRHKPSPSTSSKVRTPGRQGRRCPSDASTALPPPSATRFCTSAAAMTISDRRRMSLCFEETPGRLDPPFPRRVRRAAPSSTAASSSSLAERPKLHRSSFAAGTGSRSRPCPAIPIPSYSPPSHPSESASEHRGLFAPPRLLLPAITYPLTFKVSCSGVDGTLPQAPGSF